MKSRKTDIKPTHNIDAVQSLGSALITTFYILSCGNSLGSFPRHRGVEMAANKSYLFDFGLM